MNNAFSSNFDVVYERLLCFWEYMVCLGIVQKTKYIFLALGMWECSSVVQHSTANREVSGPNPLSPFFIIMRYLSKDFRYLKYINLVHYFEQPRHMNNDFSSNFIAIYHRLLYFWEINGIFLALGCGSVAQW